MVEELYTLHREALLKYCIVMCGDRALSEDIVQNAFMRAISHYEDLERLNAAQRRSWLYRTARNLFYDHVRRAAIAKEKEGSPPDEFNEGGYGEAEMRMILARLPYELSVLFEQRYLQGYSASDLSEMYGVASATIRGRLMKARTILKEYLMEE